METSINFNWKKASSAMDNVISRQPHSAGVWSSFQVAA